MINTSSTHFVVTRPINRVTNLLESLQALSCKNAELTIQHYPLIQISDYYDDEFFTNLSIRPSLNQFDGVIFISGNAVDSAKQQLSIQQWQQLLENPLYAIGEQTAKVLQSEVNNLKQAKRSKVKYPEIMNSEGMLAMPELTDSSGQSWLIVKGLGGRDKLKQGLCNADANVYELAVYQRKLPDLTTQKEIESLAHSHPIWLVTSSQALNNLYRIINRSVQSCRIIVSSDRIANEAQKLGFSIVATSADATDKKLVECVAQLIRKEA